MIFINIKLKFSAWEGVKFVANKKYADQQWPNTKFSYESQPNLGWGQSSYETKQEVGKAEEE